MASSDHYKKLACPPRVYFARAIDGRDVAEERRLGAEIAREAQARGFELIDPLREVPRTAGPTASREQVSAIVEEDLALLQSADAVLMDLSLPGHSYLGCICELVYAYLVSIPVVVYVGNSGNDARLWLRYHATHICGDYMEALGFLATLFSSAGRGPK